jgi:hypothetical protein
MAKVFVSPSGGSVAAYDVVVHSAAGIDNDNSAVTATTRRRLMPYLRAR